MESKKAFQRKWGHKKYNLWEEVGRTPENYSNKQVKDYI